MFDKNYLGNFIAKLVWLCAKLAFQNSVSGRISFLQMRLRRLCLIHCLVRSEDQKIAVVSIEENYVYVHAHFNNTPSVLTAGGCQAVLVGGKV